MNDLPQEAFCMINDRFGQHLSAIPAGNPGREDLAGEKYLGPSLSFVRENMRAYRVIYLRIRCYSGRKRLSASAGQSSFRP